MSKSTPLRAIAVTMLPATRRVSIDLHAAIETLISIDGRGRFMDNIVIERL